MRRHIPVSLAGTALAMTVALLSVTPASAAPADKDAVLAAGPASAPRPDSAAAGCVRPGGTLFSLFPTPL
ncbi:hypothetical protein [Streptomyces sp. NPDC014727]|uniref:hypothetical protein n=1 Tax=Streptomyces sp. NPDC014727 TaxID=3364883 RepID=UPI0036F72827